MRKFIDHDSFVCKITTWNIIRDTISTNKNIQVIQNIS